MRVFKLKKGGETENVDEVIVILTRPIDDELLKKAINICADNQLDINQTLDYIDEQFNCLDFASLGNLETFYC